MNATLLLALVQTAATAPLAPPADWSQLPSARWRTAPRYDAAVSRFVADEVKAGRCAAAQRSAHGQLLVVEAAVLATEDGRVRAVVPRAIQCPTVEQYTSGLLQSVARGQLDTAGQTGDSWYRASVTYSW